MKAKSSATRSARAQSTRAAKLAVSAPLAQSGDGQSQGSTTSNVELKLDNNLMAVLARASVLADLPVSDLIRAMLAIEVAKTRS